MEGLPSAIALQACARIVGTLRQACDSTLTSYGFESVQQTAAEALTDLLAGYIVEVGWRAAAVSSHASRTECSLPDVLQAIAAIGAAPHPLELQHIAMDNRLAFPHSVPPFPRYSLSLPLSLSLSLSLSPARAFSDSLSFALSLFESRSLQGGENAPHCLPSRLSARLSAKGGRL